MALQVAEWAVVLFVIIPILILAAIYFFVRVVSSAWHAPTKKVAVEQKYEAPREPLPNRVFCRWCGTQIPANSDYCPKCGRSQR